MVQGLDGKAYSHQVKACLLFAEHNILCQGFVIITSLRYSMIMFSSYGKLFLSPLSKRVFNAQ